MKKIFYSLLLAQTGTGGTGFPGSGTGGTPQPGSGFGGTGGGGLFSLDNPLQYDSVVKLLNAIARFLLTIAVPIATIIIIYGAFLILTSAGEIDKVTQGKKAILYAVIGLAIMLLFRVLMALLASLFGTTLNF